MIADSQLPRVSVIVPVRNGRGHLTQLLEALASQTLASSDFELVIADDGSTDGTAEWLRSIERDGIRVTADVPRNSYAARNRAVAAARGAILAFCDADCIPEPDWLERGLAALEHSDVVAGRFRFILPSRRTIWTLLDMDTSKDHEREVANGTAETANLFLRRELFEQLGGFEQAIAEYGDFDFAQRAVAMGASLRYAPSVVVWHPTRDRAGQLFRAHWVYNRGYGAREGRAGKRPAEVKWSSLVPFVSVARSRRWWGRSCGPDTRWLGENGVTPSRHEVALALPVMYIVLPYLRLFAQCAGWIDGRRLRVRNGDVTPMFGSST